MSQSEINAYFKSITRYPVLSKEAQLLHCQRIHAWVHYPGGREAAPPAIARAGSRSMQAMTQTNLRLVVSVAKGFLNRGLEFSDLIQEGTLGLIHGLELYDPTRGYAVSTYVYWWIRQSITRALYTYSRAIRIPINAHETAARINKCVAEYSSQHGRNPTVPEIAKQTRLSESRVTLALDAHKHTRCVSVDALCADGNSPIIDLIQAPETTENSPDEFALVKENEAVVQGALHILTEIEARVITSTFFSDNSLVELSSEIGVSRSRLSQIQRAALNKLRLFLRRQGYEH